ncbi:hypothetical protein ACFQZS_01425 [Mucilaginibacter calamicampi]|uniref:DUF306 domain-containing protein n=1 Tax=Mucilaginibacter calamicampi TaxID=1302352 RepID=A0ABW2YU18_9SPHI
MMKKLICLLPLLIFIAGCVKTNIDQPEPLVPYGTFAGKFTRTYIDPATSAKTTVTANIQLVMSDTGFILTSDADAVHANGMGDYLGNETTIEFKDSNNPTTGPPPTKSYLNGVFNYAYDGYNFRIFKVSGDDTYDYLFTKK